MEKDFLLQTDTFSGTLIIRRNAKIRRMRLRIDRQRRLPVLVLHTRMSEKAGIDFARTNAAWIQKQLARLPEKKPFSDGMMLPLFGETVKIHHAPDARRGVWLAENVIWVSGHIEHLPRRVGDFIKKEMKIRAQKRLAFFADKLHLRVGKTTVRNTTSRWGSCNRKGDISLSWRLALMPESVADYIIVHELCHIREMNHSDRFWKIVADVLPDYRQREKWLRQNADFLYSFCIA